MLDFALAVVRPSRVHGRTGLSLIKARHAQTGGRRQNSTTQAKMPDDEGLRGRRWMVAVGLRGDSLRWREVERWMDGGKGVEVEVVRGPRGCWAVLGGDPENQRYCSCN